MPDDEGYPIAPQETERAEAIYLIESAVRGCSPTKMIKPLIQYDTIYDSIGLNGLTFFEIHTVDNLKVKELMAALDQPEIILDHEIRNGTAK